RIGRGPGTPLHRGRRLQLRRTPFLVNPTGPDISHYTNQIVDTIVAWAVNQSLAGITNLMHSFGNATEPDFTALVPVYNPLLLVRLTAAAPPSSPLSPPAPAVGLVAAPPRLGRGGRPLPRPAGAALAVVVAPRPLLVVASLPPPRVLARAVPRSPRPAAVSPC